MCPPSLTVRQRALVALTALQLGLGSRAQVLARHCVTEADLRRCQVEWTRLQAERAARAEEQLAARAKRLP